jgi:ubiquinone/menaquinone biosynthesis C-methylase UbiE
MLHVQQRAGIQEGMRILDAGSGFCGPSIHLCEIVRDLSIEAITLSKTHACHANELVAAAGYSDRIHVTLGDYHSLPFPDRSFDIVLFLESVGYSYDPARLFPETKRVLRHNGKLYIKDMFCFEGPLSFDEMSELATADRLYAHITRPMSFYIDELRSCGFSQVHEAALRGASTEVMHAACWKTENRQRTLTPFGEYHYRPFVRLPVFFGEIIGVK